MGDFRKKQPPPSTDISKDLQKPLTGNMPWKRNQREILCHSRNPDYSTLLWIVFKAIILAMNFSFSKREILFLYNHGTRSFLKNAQKKEHNLRC